MKKRFLGVLLSVAMVAAVLAGCGSSGAKETAAPAGSETEAASEAASGETEAAGNTGDVITVGFSQVGAESDWRTANSESMKSTFSTENGYNLIFDDAQQKQENQIAAIRNFIQQEVDYIVLAPVTETGWDTVLQEAKDAGIPVIIVDRMVDVSDDSLYTAWVGSNFKLEGQKAMAWLDAYLEAKGRGDEEINLVDIQGTIGETSALAILIGAAILLVFKVIDLKIPLTYIGSFAVFVILYMLGTGKGFDVNYLFSHIFGGGLMLGAWFMATDYVTTPITPRGQYVYGVCLGVLTAVFRLFGGSAEGVSYAIIFCNLLVPMIERVTRHPAFGKGGKKA